MKRWLLVSAALALAALAAALIAYFGFGDRLAERIPVHWNIHMEPDAFTTRDGALGYFLAFPGVMSLFVVLMALLPWLSPRNFEVGPFADVFGYALMLAVALFGYLFAIQLTVAFGGELPGFERLFVGGFFVFFALLGNVIGKVQRNFWIGVRTPWTLASDAVWERTHRFAAWLWFAAGLLGVVAVWAGVPLPVCFALLVAAVLAPAVHSLVIYKKLEKANRV